MRLYLCWKYDLQPEEIMRTARRSDRKRELLTEREFLESFKSEDRETEDDIKIYVGKILPRM